MLNQDLRAIEPAVGLGALRLGSSGVDLIGWLGESKIVHAYGDQHLERWVYREHELYVIMNLVWDRAIQIATWDVNDKLNGRPIIGRTLPVVINELTDFGMPVADANTLKNRRAKQYELTISEHGVSFYFEDGRCSLVSVFPVEMDGRPVWPG